MDSSSPRISSISDLKILECCGLAPVSDEFSVSESAHFETLLTNLLTSLRSNQLVLNALSLPPIFMLAGLHQISGSWQSPNTLDLSNQLLQHLFRAYRVDNMLTFLTTPKESNYLISELFKPIQNLLSTKGWDSSPTVKRIAAWLQSQLPYPTLGTHLHLFFPILLRLIDDLSPDNQVIGLESSLYMTHNVTKADLLMYNRAEVLMHATERYIYSSYPRVLCSYQPLIAQLLSSIEQPPDISLCPQSLGLTQHDKYLHNLLSVVPIRSAIELKRVSVKMLSQTLPLFGPALLPHLSQIARAAECYLELPDRPKEETRFLTMDIVLFICQHCSGQIQLYLFDLTLALIKVVTQCSQCKQDQKAKSHTYQLLCFKAVSCFERLYACNGCGEKLLSYLRSVCEVEDGSTYVRNVISKFIKDVSIEKV